MARPTWPIPTTRATRSTAASKFSISAAANAAAASLRGGMDTEATRIGGAGGGQLAVGAVLAHTYEIVRFIRAGGMGEVYEARHLVDGSRLAVKVIRPDLVGDERIRAMFVREAGILRRIRDEAVVGYEGLLQDEQGRSFLVMGFIDGPSLAERAQSRPLST